MKKRMKIPEIRERIDALADYLEGQRYNATAKELRHLSNQMKRRPAVRKTAIKSKPLTDHLRAQIILEACMDPNLSQQELAGMFGVNPGRVSEVLRGKR